MINQIMSIIINLKIFQKNKIKNIKYFMKNYSLNAYFYV